MSDSDTAATIWADFGNVNQGYLNKEFIMMIMYMDANWSLNGFNTIRNQTKKNCKKINK